MSGIRIHVRNEFAYNRLDIFFIESVSISETYALYYEPGVEGGPWVRKKLDPSVQEQVVPALSIPKELAGQLVKALMENGVTLPEASYTEGQLSATERHLEDLQKIVFGARSLLMSKDTNE